MEKEHGSSYTIRLGVGILMLLDILHQCSLGQDEDED